MTRNITQFFVAIAILVAALLAYGFAYHVLGTVSATVTALANEVAAKKENASAAALAEEELERVTFEEDQIRAYFVVTDDIVSFLEGLQAKGKSLSTNVTVVSVSANPVPRPHLDLVLRIEGTFDAVARSIGAIEYSPYDLVVTNLTLDSVQNPDGTQGTWTANMKMQVGTASSTPATP
jgi:hypothetical protein